MNAPSQAHEIIQRMENEQNDARKLGQVESKDDPELRRLAKLEAIRKAEEEEIASESSEINVLTKNLKKKGSKEPKKNSHKKVSEVYDNVYGDDHIDELDKRAAKAKKFAAMKSEPKRKQRMEEEPEMKPEPKRKHKKMEEEEPEMMPEPKRKHKKSQESEMKPE